jgi:hypothetical protein
MNVSTSNIQNKHYILQTNQSFSYTAYTIHELWQTKAFFYSEYYQHFSFIQQRSIEIISFTKNYSDFMRKRLCLWLIKSIGEMRNLILLIEIIDTENFTKRNSQIASRYFQRRSWLICKIDKLNKMIYSKTSLSEHPSKVIILLIWMVLKSPKNVFLL